MSPTHFSESTLVSFRVSVDFLIKASLSVVLGEEPSTVSMSEGPSLVTEMLFFLQQRWRSCCWGSCSVYINLPLSNFEMKRNAAELMFLFMCGTHGAALNRQTDDSIKESPQIQHKFFSFRRIYYYVFKWGAKTLTKMQYHQKENRFDEVEMVKNIPDTTFFAHILVSDWVLSFTASKVVLIYFTFNVAP